MSSPPPQQPGRSSGDAKKATPSANVVTRNAARKSKVQTRAMSGNAKPSASVIAAKKKAQQKKKSPFNCELRDPYQIAMDSKSKVKGPTGFVTEPRMAEHQCLWDDNYPECPERLTRIIDRCHELNLIEQCKVYPPRAATKEELSMLHAPTVYEMMESTHQNENVQYLEDVSSKYDAIFIHPSTHELALIAAGSTIDMVDRIVAGEVQNGAAFVRPPGHHALRAEPCGYCFYNNVALAAKHAIDKRGLKRVLIVDWDVHHGQATQQMFYDDPRVVYFSIHRYEHGAFWPSLHQSEFNFIGTGRGRGTNFNVPLNQTGMGDGDYIAIWHQLLLPMALEYQPELIIISAGYDAAYGCPEGEMEVTPACYATLLQMLMSVCPAVCVVLEGGYCLPALAEGAALTLRTLLGHAPPRLVDYTVPCDSIRDTILNCIYTHNLHWSCYNCQPTYSSTGPPKMCDRGKQKHTVVVKWEGDETRPDNFPTRACYPLQDAKTKRRILENLNHLRLVTDLSTPEHVVCYTYDLAMLKHRSVKEPDHVECPERILRIHERHRDFGLLKRVRVLDAKAATDDEIVAVHAHEHLQRLKELAITKIREIIHQKDLYDSVYFHPDSLESASMAAGCVVQTVDEVLSNSSGSGVCVIRPPGHHADEDVPSGFCLLNNAVIGARHAVDNHSLKRVLILDWDVHHGNGTQRLTYDDDRILYISIHRYDNGSFFPNSSDADYTETGIGSGEGFNVNIPWNKRGMGDTEYLAVFTNIVLPIAYEYNPELVIVSAGFDACIGDPLGGCKVTPECYGKMTQLLRGLAGGRIILCLEGGYNVTSISYAMTMCTKALLGDPIFHHYDYKPICHWSAIETLNNVIKIQKNFWKSLKFRLALPLEDVLGAPPASRGLMEDYNSKVEMGRPDSTTRVWHESKRSIDEKILSLLGPNMKCLRIMKKSSDGTQRGTQDDSEIPEFLKNKMETFHLKKEVNKKEKSYSKIKCDQGGPSKEIKCDQGGSSKMVKCDKGGSSKEVKSDQAGSSKEIKCDRRRSSKEVKCDQGGSSKEVKFDRRRSSKEVKCDQGGSSKEVKCDQGGSSKEVKCDQGGSSKEVKCDQGGSSKEVKCDQGGSRKEVKCDQGGSSKEVKFDRRRSSKEVKCDQGGSSKEVKCDQGGSSKNIKTDEGGSSKETEKKVCHREGSRTEAEKEDSNHDDEKRTLVDYLAENMHAIVDGEMFAVIPIPWCPHLEYLYAIPTNVKFEQGVKCVDCDHTVENWVCLHCYITACARSINGHMQAHYAATRHPLVLSLSDLSVWCNMCDAYVDNALLYDVKNNAHRCKFNEDMPWCYEADTICMQ